MSRKPSVNDQVYRPPELQVRMQHDFRNRDQYPNTDGTDEPKPFWLQHITYLDPEKGIYSMKDHGLIGLSKIGECAILPDASVSLNCYEGHRNTEERHSRKYKKLFSPFGAQIDPYLPLSVLQTREFVPAIRQWPNDYMPYCHILTPRAYTPPVTPKTDEKGYALFNPNAITMAVNNTPEWSLATWDAVFKGGIRKEAGWNLVAERMQAMAEYYRANLINQETENLMRDNYSEQDDPTHRVPPGIKTTAAVLSVAASLAQLCLGDGRIIHVPNATFMPEAVIRATNGTGALGRDLDTQDLVARLTMAVNFVLCMYCDQQATRKYFGGSSRWKKLPELVERDERFVRQFHRALGDGIVPEIAMHFGKYAHDIGFRPEGNPEQYSFNRIQGLLKADRALFERSERFQYALRTLAVIDGKLRDDPAYANTKITERSLLLLAAYPAQMAELGLLGGGATPGEKALCELLGNNVFYHIHNGLLGMGLRIKRPPVYQEGFGKLAFDANEVLGPGNVAFTEEEPMDLPRTADKIKRLYGGAEGGATLRDRILNEPKERWAKF